jgi:hypothetical protein
MQGAVCWLKLLCVCVGLSNNVAAVRRAHKRIAFPVLCTRLRNYHSFPLTQLAVPPWNAVASALKHVVSG